MTATTFDVLGIGFGPSGLALAAAVNEWSVSSKTRPPSALFLEKEAKTEWHSGLLLPGTHVNQHLFKDLVTPRNPCSPLSFAAYLHSVGRFYDFCIWNGSPSRIEWSDYVGWVASQLKHLVRYNTSCTGVSLQPDGLFRVATDRQTYMARNVVLSSGWAPQIPAEWAKVDRQLAYHSSRFADAEEKIADLAAVGRPRVLVVGSGLSAAEVVLRLHQKFAGGIELISIHRNVPFKHYNASEFAKPVFTPEWGQRFFSSSKAERERLSSAYHSTNYTGVPPALATALWKSLYEARLMKQRTLDLIENVKVVKVESEAGVSRTTLAHIGEGDITTVSADIVVLCTGYVNSNRDELLLPLSNHLRRDRDGELVVGQDFAVALKRPALGKLFLSGHCERSHGLGDSQNFGLVAHRAGVIANAMTTHADRSAADRKSSAEPLSA
jgi:L-ornithine N5-monooxygenase